MGTAFSSLASTLLLREQLHRRAVLGSIAALLLLSMSPVLGHHLAASTGQLVTGLDHLGELCLTSLYFLLAPVHHAFHVLLVAGLAYAVWDRVRAWRRARRSLALIEAAVAAPCDRIWRAAAAAGMAPARLRVVDGLPTPALTAGLLRPVVYVARKIGDELADAELIAVLAHERAHVTRRDPLRLSVLRFLACLFFWIPALRRLADDMADEAEILADDQAARGRPLVLASALVALAQHSRGRLTSPVIVGFHRPDLLERRVRRLAGETVLAQSHVTRRSLLAALIVLALAWSSGIAVAHPIDVGRSPQEGRHCEHPNESPLGHLFCLQGPLVGVGDICPHASSASPATSG